MEQEQQSARRAKRRALQEPVKAELRSEIQSRDLDVLEPSSKARKKQLQKQRRREKKALQQDAQGGDKLGDSSDQVHHEAWFDKWEASRALSREQALDPALQDSTPDELSYPSDGADGIGDEAGDEPEHLHDGDCDVHGQAQDLQPGGSKEEVLTLSDSESRVPEGSDHLSDADDDGKSQESAHHAERSPSVGQMLDPEMVTPSSTSSLSIGSEQSPQRSSRQRRYSKSFVLPSNTSLPGKKHSHHILSKHKLTSPFNLQFTKALIRDMMRRKKKEKKDSVGGGGERREKRRDKEGEEWRRERRDRLER